MLSVGTFDASSFFPGSPSALYAASTTYALLPSAAYPIGTQAYASDLYCPVRYAATGWVPVSGNALLYQTAVAVTAPTDTSKNTLASVVVPAGSLGLNGRIRVSGWVICTNNANAKSLTVTLGSTDFVSFSCVSSGQLRFIAEIANRNSMSSNTGNAVSQYSAGGGLSGTISTGTEDTATNKTLALTITKATAGDSFVLDSVCIEILRNT